MTAAREQSANETEWEFIESHIRSPSNISQVSVEDVLPSPATAANGRDFERSASAASYSSNDAAFSPGLPSSWHKSNTYPPAIGMASAPQRNVRDRNAPSHSAHRTRAPNFRSQVEFAATPPIGQYETLATQPVAAAANGGATHHPPVLRSPVPHAYLAHNNWDIPSAVSEPVLFDVYHPPSSTQPNSLTGVTSFDMQGAPMDPWSSPEASISPQAASNSELLLPELEFNNFDFLMQHGIPPPLTFTPAEMEFNAADSDSSIFEHLTTLSPSPSIQAPYLDAIDHSHVHPAAANPPGPEQHAHLHLPGYFGQPVAREDPLSPNSSLDIPLRPSHRMTSPSPRVPSRTHSRAPSRVSSVSPVHKTESADSSSNPHAMLFFEEVLTPSNKGKIRRLSDRGSQQRHGVTKRSGGRVLGTHLDQETLQHTNKLRQIGACWICRFQRDKCQDIGGATCGPCARRHNSAHFQSEHSLGCDRTNIVTYRDDILPALMTAHFKQSALEDFAQKHIGNYLRDRVIVLQLRFDAELPCLESETYEFEPKSAHVLQQVLYHRNVQNEWVREPRACPPLCMARNPREEVYERYVDSIVDTKLEKFAATCFQDSPNDFQRRLLEAVCAFRPSVDHKELRTVFRFLVTRVLVTRTWSIPEEVRDQQLSQMRSYRPGVYGRSCSPRMTNKQIKSCFNGLHSALLHKMLGSYQEILRKSGGKWVTAFITVVVLAMVTEDCQKMMHATAEENASLGYYSKEDGERLAVYLAQNQDDKWYHIMSLFRAKFTARGFNPFREGGLKKLREKNKIDPEEVQLVQAVNSLMIEKSDFLHGRQHVPIAYANQGQYTSRLVARFLLHFWSDPQ